MRRLCVLAIALLASTVAVRTAGAARGRLPPPIQLPDTSSDMELAAAHAPILYFHPDERYRPQPIEVMLDHARLRQTTANVEVTALDRVTPADLATSPADAYIDLWYGQDDTSGYLSYTAHGSYYDRNGLRAAYPLTAYARVYRAGDGRVAIQYWLFYYYNDWYNKHEGDWEMVQVDLDPSGQPVRAAYAQHHGGTARPWSAVATTDGAHPLVFVAQGSHANYFVGDELYPQVIPVGNVQITVYDRTGRWEPEQPEIRLLTEDTGWLDFAGNWGERAFGEFSGPQGPAHKGLQWTDPLAWADRQPSDAARWYYQNTRADIDALPYAATLLLSNAPDADAVVGGDPPRQSIIVHPLPEAAAVYDLRLQASAPLTQTLVVEWADGGAQTVTRREYPLATAGAGVATTRLCAVCDFVLSVDTNGDGQTDERLPPARTTSRRVDFDPPESVLMYLPPAQIILGLALALAGAMVPTLVYVLIVWWADRYEAEPVHLMAAAFLWGAIPGTLIAVAARFFVTGALTPILTDTILFAAIAFIFHRYRSEFDDVLDGIVYGSLVGIGFSMTTNLITYVVGFLYGGFAFLGASVILNGIAFGLNQAYYGAVIGIGFGVARWAADPRVRRWSPWIAWAVAISLSLFNDALRDAAVGDRAALVIIPLIGTWAGIVAVAAIAVLSVRREQETIRAHLKAEVDRRTLTPNEYFYLSTPRRRSQLLLEAARHGPAALARGFKLQDLAARLAFQRRELTVQGIDPEADSQIAELRAQIASLRPPRPERGEAAR